MNLETIKSELEANVPGCRLEIMANASPSAQHSLLVDAEHAFAVASYPARRHPALRLLLQRDRRRLAPKGTLRKGQGQEDRRRRWRKKSMRSSKTNTLRYLEVVYHLFSQELKHGPLPLRMRTRTATAASICPRSRPIWRSAEFQEREIFDLFGSHLRRAPRPAPHPDVGRFRRPSHAPRLRRSGRLRIRADRARRSVAAGKPARGRSGREMSAATYSTAPVPDDRRQRSSSCWKSRWGRSIPPRMASFA